MKLFADTSTVLTAIIDADQDNGFWPEFRVHFRPAVEFEVSRAIAGGDSGKMQFLKDKITSWEGLYCDNETAQFLNEKYGKLLNNTFDAGSIIPYHAELLKVIHSAAVNMIWLKVAGLAKLGKYEPTSTDALAAKAKN